MQRKTPRFELRLDDQGRRELELTAEMLGISMAEVVKRGVARVREEHVRRQDEIMREFERSGGKRAQGGTR